MDVRQPAVLLTQNVNSIPENALHHLLLGLVIQVHVDHLRKEAAIATEVQNPHVFGFKGGVQVQTKVISRSRSPDRTLV